MYMIKSINYNKMKKADIIKRCKTLEEILIKKLDMNIAQQLLDEREEDTKTQYGIDAYFNKENEEEVCINVNFNNI